MTFEGDDSNLVAIFTGHRMEAELIRSLLESNEIPAAVFGEGTYSFGADNVSPTERVMVRADHVDAARAAIEEAGVLDDDGSVDLGEEADDVDAGFEDDGFDDDDEWAETGEGAEIEQLAGTSDWGPRLVGLLGFAALVVAVVVIVMKST